jgi:tetratricopeptide (TPR) repeat protein
VVAHHFTQAGLDDEAIEWWGKAGDQALRRSAFQEAIAHLGKAIAMADKAAGRTASAAAARQGGAARTVAPGLRVKLQTDYGRALMWGKGFDAEETKVAFARVGEFEASAESAAARFVALDAQCLRSFTRGEYAEARDIAETFLQEAEAEGRAMEAGAARRMLGLVLLHQGNLHAARSILEQALADYVPERDAATQSRFGRDTEVSAAAYLALTYWHLGKLERARQSIARALQRADELGSVAARANALYWQTVLEAHRGDASATHAAADALLRLTDECGIRTYADFCQIFASWAYGRLTSPEAGAERLKQAIATLNAAQGGRTGTKWYQGLLAELELVMSRPDGALQQIDQALEITDLKGGHYQQPRLHRLRGDILLKRDPSNPAPAEDAYRTAIAIAQQQGARSYEVLAALSLAKLHESTGRPAEAHAVLALALEGFSPTPEMPEIAEAQALLSRLA